jgi:hypothetical protein
MYGFNKYHAWREKVMHDLTTYAVQPAHAIIFALLYYIFINSFLNEVAIRRLTKSSFRMGFTDLLDLTIAYILASLACVFIFFSNTELENGSLYLKIFDVIKCPINETYADSLVAVVVGLLFLGRIITKRKGTFYGRLHFTAIFVATSIYLTYDLINVFIQSSHIPRYIYEYSFIGINHFLDFLNYFSKDLSVGIFFLVTFCELGLSLSATTQKNIFVVTGKFPSDFRVITGYSGIMIRKINQILDIIKKFLRINIGSSLHDQWENHKTIMLKKYYELKSENPDIGTLVQINNNSIWDDDGIYNKLNEILCKEDGPKIKKVLCITRSLVMIQDTIDLLIKCNKMDGLDIKTIISPSQMALRDHDFAMNNWPTSLGDFINFKNYKIQKYNKGYCKRFIYLNHLCKKYFLKTKLYYFGSVVFLLVEFDEYNKKEILFSIRDSGSLMRRVGLHSKEPHIVKYFENMFESIWKLDLPSHQDEFASIFGGVSDDW